MLTLESFEEAAAKVKEVTQEYIFQFEGYFEMIGEGMKLVYSQIWAFI